MDILKYITTFLSDFVKILAEMSPYLLLGFFFSGLLYAFVPQNKIERYFNGGKLRSAVLSSLFGIPLPLCSCGVIPTGVAFYNNGASRGGTVSFLISTPQTGVDSVLATFSLMGLPFAIIRPIAAFVTGISGGLITGVVTQNETKPQQSIGNKGENRTFSQKVKATFRYGFVDFIQDISKWLVIGLVLAAIISALIPNDFFEILNLAPVYQMLLILVVSIPLYICATGSIPLAAILILKGISPGAAFVLLMAGPATNVATITMIWKVLGRKSLLVYLATIISGAMGFGLIIDYFLPAHWFTVVAQQHIAHHDVSLLSWWKIMSAILLVVLILNGYVQRYINTQRNKQTITNTRTMKITKIKVEGMTCNHCKANVENNLVKIPSVDRAIVDLAEKTVDLEGEDIDKDEVAETLNGLGYRYIP